MGGVLRLFCLLLFFSITITSYGYQSRNVIILVIDGARYSETFGDSTHQYIPRMWNSLRPRGTIYTRFYNDSITTTAPGHGTIVTGVWQNITNDGVTPLPNPTIFEYYKKKYPSSDECFVILGKHKLDILASSTDPRYGTTNGASVKYCDNYTDDKNTWNNIREILSGSHPRLAVSNLGQVDAYGHAGDWGGYLASIRQVDSIVWLTWSLLQSDPFYKDSTILIVVNDHGRHTDDFTSHGCTCEGCRHILCMMIGPDSKAGVIDSTHRQQIDIAPTVGALLDFPTPFATGKILTLSLIDPQHRPAVPSVPLLLFPADSAVDQLRTQLLEWQKVNNADSYGIQIAQTADFLHPLIDESTMTNSFKIMPSVLDYGTEYFWRVQAINPGGSSSWSPVFTFITYFGQPEIIPLSPESNTRVSGDSVILSWTASDTSVKKYHLEILIDTEIDTIIFTDSTLVETHKLYYFKPGNKTYRWRVRGYTSYGWTGWCEYRSFNTELPPVDRELDNLNSVSKRIVNNGKMLNIYYKINKASAITITLYALSGRPVVTINQTYKKPGIYKIHINTSNFPGGCYILSVRKRNF